MCDEDHRSTSTASLFSLADASSLERKERVRCALSEARHRSTERESPMSPKALFVVKVFGPSAPAFAAQLPTVAQCHAVAEKRDSGETAGFRNHEKFIQACLSGRVPMKEIAGVPEAVRDYRAESYGKCHELAEQRGAGETSGQRNHNRFVEQC